MRLQLEARVGKSIMEYIFPGRRERKTRHKDHSHLKDRMDRDAGRSTNDLFQNAFVTHSNPMVLQRSSAEVPRSPTARYSFEENRLAAPSGAPARLGATRSFSDLRQASRHNSMQKLDKQSPYLLADRPSTTNLEEYGKINTNKVGPIQKEKQTGEDDATEMKTRSSQNTFVLVNISR